MKVEQLPDGRYRATIALEGGRSFALELSKHPSELTLLERHEIEEALRRHVQGRGRA